MTLSIVIPVLNEAAGIETALARLGVLRQRGVEVIIADGGSADATAALAASHCDRVVTAPRGRAQQMNAGAAAARGDVLLFLHADTQLPENADRLVLDGLRNGRHVWGRFDVRIDGPPALAIVALMMNLRSRATGIATGDQAIFVTREAFERAGRFPEIMLMEDIALSARLLRQSRPLCLGSRAVTSGRRWQQHGVLRTILLMWRLRFAYWRGADPADLARQYGYVPKNIEPAAATVAIAILAKAPVAGLAKTRLIPALGAHGAAVLADRFIERTVETAIAADIGPVTLWAAPDPSHRCFQDLAVRHALTLAAQPDGDLGVRMLAAMRSANGPVVVVGTDCPALTTDHLRQAAAALRGGNDVVTAPADDGGYVLIGVSRPLPELMDGMTWSTTQVMCETRRRIAQRRLRAHELPMLWDVDEPADLDRLEREFPSLAP